MDEWMNEWIKDFIHSFIHPSIHPSIHSFIHPSIHPFIHSFISLQKTNTFLFEFSLKRSSNDSSLWRILTIHSLQMVTTVNKADETVFFTKKCLIILPLTFLRLTNFKTSHDMVMKMFFCLFSYMQQLYAYTYVALIGLNTSWKDYLSLWVFDYLSLRVFAEEILVT